MFCSRVFKLFLAFLIFFTWLTAFPSINSFQAEAGVNDFFTHEPPPAPPPFQPEPLSKKGTVGVVVEGVDYHHNVTVAALVCQRLNAKGYKVVDKKTLAAIRDHKMAIAALNGDTDAIIKLSSQYGVGTMITLNADATEWVNEFGRWTGSASVTVKAISSSGKIVYADTVRGKQLGGAGEAAQKAIEDAAIQAVERMTQ